MAKEKIIRVGVVGLGFMGRTHIAAYEGAHAAGFANRLVAVADTNPERRSGRTAPDGNLTQGDVTKPLFDTTSVKCYATAAELIADPEIDLVSICTHTDTHVDFATAAITAGKHVLVEKPVGVDAETIKPLAALVRRKKRLLCMPALCIRFWPAYAWLKQRIDDGAFGKVRSAVFQRLGTHPKWGGGFYSDPTRSGGALVDLHLHDVDFLRYALGDPSAVTSTGSLDHVTSLFHYETGPEHVVAEGAWDHHTGFQFRMRFIVVFEHATVDFDFGRAPSLLLIKDGKSEAVEIDGLSGYDVEIRYLLTAIRDKRKDILSTVQGAYDTARLLDAERKSLESKKPVKFKASRS